MSEESILLSPEEIQERRKKIKETEEKKVSVPSDSQKYFNRGGTVAINYESCGRFSIPSTLYFKDYTIEDVNNLAISRQEEILENVVTILNKSVNQDANCKIEDMTVEEFLETLIGIKAQFNTNQHVHRWLCSCQEKEQEEERTPSETIIDLTTLQYTSIEQADSKLREYMKETFESMSDEEWKSYLFEKYKDSPLDSIESYTKEEELAKIKIKEPIMYFVNGHSYEFRLTRIGDLVTAQKLASKQAAPKIKQIQSRKEPNIPLLELKTKKEKEIEDVKFEQTRKATLYSRALSLLKVDGKPLPENERIEYYKNLPRQALLDFITLIDNAVFGVNDEREITCNLCGKTERRSLRQDINPVELLPLDPDSSRTVRKSSGTRIYFGL